MPRDAWELLIERYADGRRICNCGQAYYRPKARFAATTTGGSPVMQKTWVCQFGCQANQIAAKRDLAERVLSELKKP